MAIYQLMVFTQVINTGINDDALKPCFKQGFCIKLPAPVEQVQVFEQLHKRFIGKLLCFVLLAGVPIADFHGIAVQPAVQGTLALAVVFATSVNERQYMNCFIAQSIVGVRRYGKLLYTGWYVSRHSMVACGQTYFSQHPQITLFLYK
jgi:hypothetical protein